MTKGKRRAAKAAGAVAVALVALVALWIAIHRVPWLGPMLADGARAVVGPAAVATAEDVAYGLDDRWNRLWRGNEAPQPYWDVPQPAASPPAASVPAASAASSSPSAEPPPFRPADVGPVHPSYYAKGDGVWIPVVEADCGERPCMYKTLLHPDRVRGWAAVAVAAIDTTATRVQLVPGFKEPRATEREAQGVQRPGLVPAEDRPALIAAFNGSFKTEHGQLGMHVDGLTFIGPQRWACTVARLEDDRLAIATWSKLQPRLDGARWWRQAPTCLVEDGSFAAGVHSEQNINWGRAVSGETVIRRSAVGLDASGRTLFVGISDATSAGAIARAMRHAGAHTVAQLDVNHSFPKFLVFERQDEHLLGKPLCPGFLYSEKDYVEKAAPRDFFYVTRAVHELNR